MEHAPLLEDLRFSGTRAGPKGSLVRRAGGYRHLRIIGLWWVVDVDGCLAWGCAVLVRARDRRGRNGRWCVVAFAGCVRVLVVGGHYVCRMYLSSLITYTYMCVYKRPIYP